MVSLKKRLSRVSLCACFGLLISCWLDGGGHLCAQEARYELGRRLKRFEQQWEVADQQGRTRSTAWMEKAVSSFFSLQLLDAAKMLDLATVSLQQTAGPDDDTAWILSRRFAASPLMADTSQTELKLELSALYIPNKQSSEDSTKIKVRITIHPLATSGDYALAIDQNATPVYQSDWISSQTLEQGWTWRNLRLKEGDYMVFATAMENDTEIDLASFAISRAEQFEKRFGALLDASETLQKSGIKTTGIATIRGHVFLLENIKDGVAQESDFPATRLLLDAETLIDANGNIDALLNKQFTGDTWLTIAKERRSANVRLRVPVKTTESYPVLFLFHGAGGSENMFFETYGAGRAVELAAQRGWIVIATRQRLLGGIGLSCTEILDEIERCLPLDRDRVFFMGHSMGAAQATEQALQAPNLPAGVIALGGGGRLGGREPGGAPWFVAAGDRDFGKAGAKRLANELTSKGKTAQWKEYPQTEHMVIVQVALDNVFEFLDSIMNRPTEQHQP